MKKGFASLVAVVCLFTSLATKSEGNRPIVAVFDIETKRVKLSAEMMDALADYLTSRLTETGKYQVVPRDQLRERLAKQKKASYKQCYDQKCQIEMGRELAAEKTVATQVSKFADVCTLSVTIYDLRKAATESAATEKGECDEEGLLASLDKAVNKLVGRTPDKRTATRSEAKEGSKRGPSGIEWLKSIPTGIEFTKSEVTVGQFRACVDVGMCREPRSGKHCNWGLKGVENHPVNCVDWKQAASFCKWARGRLPTEEEWYTEASNGGKRKYPWGDAKVTCDYAVCDEGASADGCGKDSTWPVCSKPSGNSVSGLCDMSGNVFEWTTSSHDTLQSNRVIRGGAWSNANPKFLRASSRLEVDQTKRNSSRGFRCVRSSSDESAETPKPAGGEGEGVNEEIPQKGTDLFWLRCPIGRAWNGSSCIGKSTVMDWETALKSCPSGYRIPTRKEFMKLLGGCEIDVHTGKSGSCYACMRSSTCLSLFDNDVEFYWSSSSVDGNPKKAWISDFFSGRIYKDMKTAKSKVRCLRD